jgi:hypothetical protein
MPQIFFYVTVNLIGQKVGVETVLQAFTDHLAVCLRFQLDVLFLQLGRRLSQMNMSLFEETAIRSRFK